MIMYLCTYHEHLHAWYRDPRYEHVPPLPLESSEIMKVEYIHNYKVLDSMTGWSGHCEKISFYVSLKQNIFLGPEG